MAPEAAIKRVMQMSLAASCGVMPAGPRVWYVPRLPINVPPFI